jgi:hypothetical protein
MPQLFTITDEWNEQFWFSTGGTRAKKYLQSPEGKFYYFKRSQYKETTENKPGKDFKYEFWSEVIAYEAGTLLGFNMLQYDIAIFGDIMGCISESMINSEEEDLIEGVKYLQAFAPTYDPVDKSHQNRYTFQLIENALEKAKFKDEIENIIEIIILDALIGNGDRHQENWAFINKQKLVYEAMAELENSLEFAKLKRWRKGLLKWMKQSLKLAHKSYKEKGIKPPKSFYTTETKFAPIYDSGSSLGRELLDQRVGLFLQSEEEINRYIDRGLAEIHWEGKKISHFALVKNLLQSPLHNEPVKKIIKRVLENWDNREIERLVREVDQKVPKSHEQYKIPESRKELILKLITLRSKRLEGLIHEGV